MADNVVAEVAVPEDAAAEDTKMEVHTSSLMLRQRWQRFLVCTMGMLDEDDVEHVEGGVEGADVSDLYQDDELCCDEAPDVEEEPLCQQVGSDMIGSGSPPDPRSALDHPGPGRTSHDGHAHAADAGGEGNPVPTQQLQPDFHDGGGVRQWCKRVLTCARLSVGQRLVGLLL